MIGKPSRIVCFSFEKNLIHDPNIGEPEDLQITVLNDIGAVGLEVKQKIIRLDDSQQRELFELLRSKFGNNKAQTQQKETK